jgi:hypothetical protein
MTPEERMNRVIKILTGAVVNVLLSGEKSLNENNTPSVNPIDPEELFPPRFEHEYGPARFGYKETPDGQFTNDTRNSILKIIREMTKGKKSIGNITKHLNAEGYRTKRGKKWSKSSVWRFQGRYLKPNLSNPKSAPIPDDPD